MCLHACYVGDAGADGHKWTLSHVKRTRILVPNASTSTEKLNMQCLVGIASPDCDVETYLGHRRGGYGFFAAEGTLKVDGDWKGGHGLVGSGLLVAGFECACAC